MFYDFFYSLETASASTPYLLPNLTLLYLLCSLSWSFSLLPAGNPIEARALGRLRAGATAAGGGPRIPEGHVGAAGPTPSHCVKSGPGADSGGGAGPARAICSALGQEHQQPGQPTPLPGVRGCRPCEGQTLQTRGDRAPSSAAGGAETGFPQEVWALSAREPGSRLSPAQSPSHLCSWGWMKGSVQS